MESGQRVIRWGIPGWILLFWILILITLQKHDIIIKFLQNDTISSLSITAILTGVGIPLGYLIHEVYFAIFWTIKKVNIEVIIGKIQSFPRPSNWDTLNNKERYYFVEFLWDKYLNNKITEEEVRNQIKERYRERLTLIHSLGTLLLSMILATAISLMMLILFYSWSILVAFIIQLLICISVYKNYTYHSLQLMHYQGYYLNDLINEPNS